MRLVRAHGLGNDYLVLEEGGPIDADLARALCDRHRGVGGDGILEPADPGGADHGVRIWNPDGSVAEKSGNGLRIFARWLADRRAGTSFTVWTGTDTVTCRLAGDAVEVAMGRARVGVAEEVEGLTLVPVDLGNPHCVLFREEDLDTLPWRAWGERLEGHPRFPARTNVQVARVVAGGLDIRIWERGAGPTLASGSSSCAAAAAAVATGRLSPGRIPVTMPGGVLHVTVGPDGEVLLEGPVEVVGTIEVDPRWLAARRP